MIKTYTDPTMEVRIDFWRQVKVKEGVNECWLWAGRRAKDMLLTASAEQPQLYVRGRMMSARRVIWELCGGKLHKITNIRAKCRTSCCVRPSHMTDTRPSTWTTEQLERPFKTELPISDEEARIVHF